MTTIDRMNTPNMEALLEQTQSLMTEQVPQIFNMVKNDIDTLEAIFAKCVFNKEPIDNPNEDLKKRVTFFQNLYHDPDSALSVSKINNDKDAMKSFQDQMKRIFETVKETLANFYHMSRKEKPDSEPTKVQKEEKKHNVDDFDPQPKKIDPQIESDEKYAKKLKRFYELMDLGLPSDSYDEKPKAKSKAEAPKPSPKQQGGKHLIKDEHAKIEIGEGSGNTEQSQTRAKVAPQRPTGGFSDSFTIEKPSQVPSSDKPAYEELKKKIQETVLQSLDDVHWTVSFTKKMSPAAVQFLRDRLSNRGFDTEFVDAITHSDWGSDFTYVEPPKIILKLALDPMEILDSIHDAWSDKFKASEIIYARKEKDEVTYFKLCKEIENIIAIKLPGYNDYRIYIYHPYKRRILEWIVEDLAKKGFMAEFEEEDYEDNMGEYAGFWRYLLKCLKVKEPKGFGWKTYDIRE